MPTLAISFGPNVKNLLGIQSLFCGTSRVTHAVFRLFPPLTTARDPWWNCYRLCLKWKKVLKWKRLARVSVSVKLVVAASAVLSTRGKATVIATGEFDKLRLDYYLLDKIELERIANKALKDKAQLIYDATQLVATVPIIAQKFRVSKVGLPSDASGVPINVDVEKV